jgi:hypothetical protein
MGGFSTDAVDDSDETEDPLRWTFVNYLLWLLLARTVILFTGCFSMQSLLN